MTNKSASLDRVFQALADPTRRAIVKRLSKGPASVSDLVAPFHMAMPTLLQHIRVLEKSGLVSTEKTGRVRTCAMRPSAFSAAEGWLAEQRTLWEGRLDRMEAYVTDLNAKEMRHGKSKK